MQWDTVFRMLPCMENPAETGPGMPRWVKVFLAVGLALVLLFAVARLTGVGGDHGPGRHGGGSTATSGVHDRAGHNPP